MYLIYFLDEMDNMASIYGVYTESDTTVDVHTVDLSIMPPTVKTLSIPLNKVALITSAGIPNPYVMMAHGYTFVFDEDTNLYVYRTYDENDCSVLNNSSYMVAETIKAGKSDHYYSFYDSEIFKVKDGIVIMPNGETFTSEESANFVRFLEGETMSTLKGLK